MSDPKGNSFVLARVMMFVSGNIRTRGKTKLTGFPRDLTLNVLLYFQTFTSTATKENRNEPKQSTRYL